MVYSWGSVREVFQAAVSIMTHNEAVCFRKDQSKYLPSGCGARSGLLHQVMSAIQIRKRKKQTALASEFAPMAEMQL